MDDAQALAKVPGQRTLVPFISEPNFYSFLGEVNSSSFLTQLPAARGITESISFTQSSLSHDLKFYPFLYFHPNITQGGRTQTALSSEAKKFVFVSLQMDCSKHIFSYLCRSTRKSMLQLIHPFHGTRVISSRCLRCKIILGKLTVLQGQQRDVIPSYIKSLTLTPWLCYS